MNLHVWRISVWVPWLRRPYRNDWVGMEHLTLDSIVLSLTSEGDVVYAMTERYHWTVRNWCGHMFAWRGPRRLTEKGAA